MLAFSAERSNLPRMLKRLRAIGPGALTAAAFIGPGTVTTATFAGAAYGYALAWALVFATFAAIVLQETAARLGVVARLGLGEAVMQRFSEAPVLRWAAGALIVAALFIGNAAYEGGNLAGAVLGLEAAAPGVAPRSVLAAFVAAGAGAALVFGGYRAIEKILIAAVLLMTLSFAAALFVIGPDWRALFKGAFVPRIPQGSFPLILGLIGTTIVPYNLFLHAATARKKWAGPSDLNAMRFDARLSIGLGGAVSILVLSTAAASLFGTGIAIASAGDMARQLEPAFGAAATWLIAIGLFAAGFSSAMTAPLATGFAAAELFGFASDPATAKFRLVAGAVLLVGAVIAITGAKPVELILFAQIANGVLLPVIAGFLLYAANSRKLLGAHANGAIANAAGILVTLIAAMLGLRGVLRAFGVM